MRLAIAYQNRLPNLLEAELEEAEEVGIRGCSPPSAEFDALLRTGDRLIFVVSEGGELIVSARSVNLRHARHSVIAQGADVLAAGELEVAWVGNTYYVIQVTNASGHYQPPPACLDVAVELLELLGFTVPTGCVQPYTG